MSDQRTWVDVCCLGCGENEFKLFTYFDRDNAETSLRSICKNCLEEQDFIVFEE